MPGRDGRLVVGATCEDVSFDERRTQEATAGRLATTQAALPAAAGLEVAETWVGFRPGSPDHAPILGPCEAGGLVPAMGHGHNGILMTPTTPAGISR